MLDHGAIKWDDIGWAEKRALEKEHIVTHTHGTEADAAQYVILSNTKKMLYVATHNPERLFNDTANIGKKIIHLLLNKVEIMVLTDNETALANNNRDLEILRRYASDPFEDRKIKAGLVKELPVLKDNYPAEMLLSDKHVFIVGENSPGAYSYSHNCSMLTRHYMQVFQDSLKDAVPIDLVYNHDRKEQLKERYTELKNNTFINRVKNRLKTLSS